MGFLYGGDVAAAALFKGHNNPRPMSKIVLSRHKKFNLWVLNVPAECINKDCRCKKSKQESKYLHLILLKTRQKVLHCSRKSY